MKDRARTSNLKMPTQKPSTVDEGSIRSDTLAFMKSIGLGDGIAADNATADIPDVNDKKKTNKKTEIDKSKKTPASDKFAKGKKPGKVVTSESATKAASSDHLKGSKGARWGKGAKVKQAYPSAAVTASSIMSSSDWAVPADGVTHWWRKKHSSSGGLLLSTEGDAHWFDFIPKGTLVI